MLRALETFHTGSGSIVRGERVAEDHPVVAGREHLFERVDDEADEAAPKPRRRTRRAAE